MTRRRAFTVVIPRYPKPHLYRDSGVWFVSPFKRRSILDRLLSRNDLEHYRRAESWAFIANREPGTSLPSRALQQLKNRVYTSALDGLANMYARSQP